MGKRYSDGPRKYSPGYLIFAPWIKYALLYDA